MLLNKEADRTPFAFTLLVCTSQLYHVHVWNTRHKSNIETSLAKEPINQQTLLTTSCIWLWAFSLVFDTELHSYRKVNLNYETWTSITEVYHQHDINNSWYGTLVLPFCHHRHHSIPQSDIVLVSLFVEVMSHQNDLLRHHFRQAIWFVF